MNKWLKIYCVVLLLVMFGFFGLFIYAVISDLKDIVTIAIFGVLGSYCLIKPIRIYYELKEINNEREIDGKSRRNDLL